MNYEESTKLIIAFRNNFKLQNLTCSQEHKVQHELHWPPGYGTIIGRSPVRRCIASEFIKPSKARSLKLKK